MLRLTCDMVVNGVPGLGGPGGGAEGTTGGSGYAGCCHCRKLRLSSHLIRLINNEAFTLLRGWFTVIELSTFIDLTCLFIYLFTFFFLMGPVLFIVHIHL